LCAANFGWCRFTTILTPWEAGSFEFARQITPSQEHLYRRWQNGPAARSFNRRRRSASPD